LSNIRVTYSGLISLGVGLVRIFTGLIFMVIVTRMLSQLDFGTWGLINSILIYGLAINGVVNFWTTREIARGNNVGKTSIFSSGLFSIIGVIIYGLFSVFISPQSNVNVDVLLLAAILLPTSALQKTISNINMGWKPQIASYGILIIEIVKIPLAIFLIYILNLGVTGVILSVFFAVMSSIIIQGILSRKKIKGQFNFQIFKKWIRFSWLPMYPKMSNLLFVSDIIVFSIITESVIGISYFSASLVIASLTVYAAGISTSVYPKLLSGDKGKMITRNLTYLLFFSIPLLFTSITFAKQGLFILNPIYENASTVVIFLAFRMFFMNLSGISGSILMGVENVDKNLKSTVRDYMKSKLIIIPTLRLIQFVIYLLILIIVLSLFANSSNYIELVTYWSFITMIVEIPLTFYFMYSVKHKFQLKFEIKSITKYILIGLISFSFIYILAEEFFVYSESLFNVVLQVIGLVILGTTIYTIIIYYIDKPIKLLINSIISEIKNIKK
jgi:O-antigen/teichoic acid export membrane protein